MAADRTFTDVNSFVAAIQSASSDYQRRMEICKFEIAQLIQRQAQQNIKDTFGRGSGATASGAGRSGALQASVGIERLSNGDVVVKAGGGGVPYAAIHEFGGDITPQNAQWLTIPAMAEYVGHRAREFGNLMFRSLAKPDKYGNPMAMLINRTTDEAAYLLLKRVTIPARPYLQPAVDKVMASNEVKEKIAKYLTPEV